jgi:ubiquinone/menaquinone biosynthesis C-methylase UbiE
LRWNRRTSAAWDTAPCAACEGYFGEAVAALVERGVRVAGFDNSQAMLARLREKPESERIDATVGDMAATRLASPIELR